MQKQNKITEFKFNFNFPIYVLYKTKADEIIFLNLTPIWQISQTPERPHQLHWNNIIRWDNLRKKQFSLAGHTWNRCLVSEDPDIKFN